ncbi:alpha,alpha-trehalose-phosphate synthase [UDP-forming] 1-like [Argentina anserina]|uniref:alpha,alpha-trehalose-phosphate synthase [UDP-forming] 1-like n=1 Tax=Argentina anserina TaxID=57926 RepID=UPI0021768630|nr:alpha,alpha-trehalose-phosphate synthase [UDP-forming] 1-like [Potentilla anserina]
MYNSNSSNIPGLGELLKTSGRVILPSEHEREEVISENSLVEKYLNGAPAATALNANHEKQEGGRLHRQRLMVVANRLPVSAVREGEDSWSLEISPGGLVSALSGVNDIEARWIGWAGVNVPDDIGQKSLTKALAEKKCIPVFLDEELVHQYYNGFCNNILWPLFHYLGFPQEDRTSTRSFQSQFSAYRKANQMFADVVKAHYEEGDVVWCHDYHLMFLPKYLKDFNSKMKVGWFLHTSFPSSEIHRTLPSRSELLRSVLAADLVGFHTYEFARNFVDSCTHILGLKATTEGLRDEGRITRVAVFPIGIDPDRFTRTLEDPKVQEHITELREKFAGRKVILGVDRLDMIKGIPQKILAFEKFLEENPNWRDKVILLQIAVPSRTDVPEYQKLTSQVHEIVGRINGRFGSLTSVPIHHLDRSVGFQALCALYAVSDVALITSLRDGMNLVCYEFVACQNAKKGVLILSEFAGAAQSIGAGAILVNPWNSSEVSNSIFQALNMSWEEREKRQKLNFAYVRTHTSQKWANAFVSELNDTVVEAQLKTRQVLPLVPNREPVQRYLQANNRLLILGFNATLTEPVDEPERRSDQNKEMELKLHPGLKEPLTALCNEPNTTIVVLSGSDRAALGENFGELNLWLAAENGMFLRPANGEWKPMMPEHLNMEWLKSVKDVFEFFTERTPRSHFELRETSIVWNYKYSDAKFGRLQARDMLHHLWTGPISKAAVDVIQGSHSVEVRAVGVTKGAAIDRILREIVQSKSMTSPIDYVLCVGHLLGKDEDVYTFFEPDLPTDISGNARWPCPEKIQSNVLDLKENYYSCSVGTTRTNARYLLQSSDEVVSFLKELASASSD